MQGTTDPEVLADLARGRLRRSWLPCAKRSRGGSGPTTPFLSGNC